MSYTYKNALYKAFLYTYRLFCYLNDINNIENLNWFKSQGQISDSSC